MNATLMHIISKVCVADVDEVKGQETAKEFCSAFGKDSAFFVKCDVTKKDEYESKKCRRFTTHRSKCVAICFICEWMFYGDNCIGLWFKINLSAELS